ncbi:MAG: phosphate acyltransferase PlsX [Fidelibacterota bacterium]
MIIAVDGMGGDHAPPVIVRGAVQAIKESQDDLQIILTGQYQQIERELEKLDWDSDKIMIHSAPQVVNHSIRPSQVVKQLPDSSIVQGIKLIKEKEADAFVSAGHTGAILSTALLLLGRIEGVRRPAISVYLPVRTRGLVLCDVGANTEVKPRHLLQFAIMASEYIKHMHGVKVPTIGLLNIGAEANKGRDEYVEAHALLSEMLPNFAGNIEARYIYDGKVDVLVCDGFVGNNLLKFAEGWIHHIHREISKQLSVNNSNKKSALNKIFDDIIREYEYEESGGSFLLGVNGVCMICHGASPVRAIKNAILSTAQSVKEQLVESIREGISQTVAQIEKT